MGALYSTRFRIRLLTEQIKDVWVGGGVERRVHDKLASVERIDARGYGAEMRYRVDVPTLRGYGSESGCGTERFRR